MELSLASGTVIASRYEIRRALGRGGMSVVFEAFDRVRKETIALKILRPDLGALPDMERRFAAEIPMAARIRQANVCHILGCGADGDLRYIAMERVDGEDLGAILYRRGALPIDEAYDVAIQLGRGVQALHVAGIVHRDIKPRNVMRDTSGRVRIMDFDIAKASRSMTCDDDTLFGTPEYASPEQACGEPPDFRADIYSLGVLIFELFTGYVPFRGHTSLDTVHMHLVAPPPLDGPRAAALPAALVPVLRKALAKSPLDRYRSARGFVEALCLARSVPPVNAAPARPAAPPETSADIPTPLRKARPVPTPTQALPVLLGALNQKDKTVRWAMVERVPLDDRSRAAIRTLLSTFDEAEEDTAPLENEDPIAELLSTLTSGVSAGRARAAKALGDAGARARRAIPKLLRALEDTDARVRREAADALVRIAESIGRGES